MLQVEVESLQHEQAVAGDSHTTNPQQDFVWIVKPAPLVVAVAL